MSNFRKFFYFYTIAGIALIIFELLSLQRSLSQLENKLTNNIEAVKQEVEKIKASEASGKLLNDTGQIQKVADKNVLGLDTASGSASVSETFITISDNRWNSLNVYSTQSLTSQIIGRLEYGKIYLAFKKEDNWYQVQLTNQKTGWVLGQYIKEVKDQRP